LKYRPSNDEVAEELRKVQSTPRQEKTMLRTSRKLRLDPPNVMARRAGLGG
jgi:hypothetical protein